MKTKRVGVISMAIVLIAFGILLFICQFSKISDIELAGKFWPLILIMIGLEILYYSYINKEGEDKFVIKYDIFSIFIVMIILVVNVVLYGFMESGILDLIKLRINEEKVIYEEYLEENYEYKKQASKIPCG